MKYKNCETSILHLICTMIYKISGNNHLPSSIQILIFHQNSIKKKYHSSYRIILFFILLNIFSLFDFQ